MRVKILEILFYLRDKLTFNKLLILVKGLNTTLRYSILLFSKFKHNFVKVLILVAALTNSRHFSPKKLFEIFKSRCSKF